MGKKVTFTEITRKVYEVSDVSPEDGVTFEFAKWMETAKRLNLRWQQEQTHCKRCKKEFKEGDRMYMAITNYGNTFLCKECARKLRYELGKPDYCKPENHLLNYVKMR